MTQQTELERAHSLIREVPNYPIQGVLFRDITPLLADAAAFRATTDALIEPFLGQFDVVAGIEARGFLLSGAAAIASGTGTVPIRKAGKLPLPAGRAEYALEYGTAAIDMHADLPKGTRFLLVDDVLATGGTLRAAKGLVEDLGYTVAGIAALFEIPELGGRALVGDVHTVFSD